MSMKSKLLIFLGVLAMLGVVALYVQEFQWFQNYINSRNMVLGALALGGLLGFGLGFYFQKTGEELVDKMRIWITCFIVPVLLMPLLASLTNRLFAERKIHETKVEFWDEGGGGALVFAVGFSFAFEGRFFRGGDAGDF